MSFLQIFSSHIFLYHCQKSKIIQHLLLITLQYLQYACLKYYDEQQQQCVDVCQQNQFIQYFQCKQNCNQQQLTLNNVQFCFTQLQYYQYTQESDLENCDKFIYQNHCVEQNFCEQNLLYVNITNKFCYNPQDEKYCQNQDISYVYDSIYKTCITVTQCQQNNLVIEQYKCVKPQFQYCQNKFKIQNIDQCVDQCPEYSQIDINNKICQICEYFDVQSQQCVQDCDYILNITNKQQTIVCSTENICNNSVIYHNKQICIDRCQFSFLNGTCLQLDFCSNQMEMISIYSTQQNNYICNETCNSTIKQYGYQNFCESQTQNCLHIDNNECKISCQQEYMINLDGYLCTQDLDQDCIQEKTLYDQKFCYNGDKQISGVNKICDNFYILEAGIKVCVDNCDNGIQFINSSTSTQEYQCIDSCQSYIINNICVEQTKYQDYENKEVECVFYQTKQICQETCDNQYIYNNICIERCQRDQYIVYNQFKQCADNCDNYVIILDNYDKICTQNCQFLINIDDIICKETCDIPFVIQQSQQKYLCQECGQNQMTNRSLYSSSSNQQNQICISQTQCSGYINITTDGLICEQQDSEYCTHYYQQQNGYICVQECIQDIYQTLCPTYNPSQNCEQIYEYKQIDGTCNVTACKYYILNGNTKECTTQCNYLTDFYQINKQNQCVEQCQEGSYVYQQDNISFCLTQQCDQYGLYQQSNTCIVHCEYYFDQQTNQCSTSCQLYYTQNKDNICVQQCDVQFVKLIQTNQYQCQDYCEKAQIIQINDQDYYQCIDQCDNLYYQYNNFTICTQTCIDNTYQQNSQCLWQNCTKYILINDNGIQCQETCNTRIIDNEFQCLTQCDSNILFPFQTLMNKIYYCNSTNICPYYIYDSMCIPYNSSKCINNKNLYDDCQEINMINSYYIQNNNKYRICVQQCEYAKKTINNKQYCVDDCYPQYLDLNGECNDQTLQNSNFIGQIQINQAPDYYMYYITDENQNKYFVEKCEKFSDSNNQCIDQCEQYVIQIRDVYYCQDTCDQDVYQLENLQFCVNCIQQIVIYIDTYICYSGIKVSQNQQVKQLCIKDQIYFDSNFAGCVSSCDQYYNGNYQCTESCTEQSYKIISDMKQCMDCTQYYIINQYDQLNYKECLDECPLQKQYIDNNQCVDQCQGNFVDENLLCIQNCDQKLKFIKQNMYQCVQQCDIYEQQINIQDNSYYQCVSFCDSGILQQNSSICTDTCSNQFLQVVVEKYIYQCSDSCEDYQQYVSLIKFGQQTMKVCVIDCPDNFYRYEQQKQCQQQCDYYYETLVETTCIDNCTDLYIIITSTDKKICVDSCQTPTLLFSKLEDGQCKSTCENPSTPYLSPSSYCVANCPDGSSLQNDICINSCTGREYIQNENICVEQCPEGKIISYKEDKYEKYSCVDQCEEQQFQVENTQYFYSFPLEFMCSDQCTQSYDTFDLSTQQLQRKCTDYCNSQIIFQHSSWCLDINEQTDLSYVIQFQTGQLFTDNCQIFNLYRSEEYCTTSCQPQQFIYTDNFDQHCKNTCNRRSRIDNSGSRYCENDCQYNLQENQHVCAVSCSISYLNGQCTTECSGKYGVQNSQCILLGDSYYQIRGTSNYISSSCDFQLFLNWNSSHTYQCLSCQNTFADVQLCVGRCQYDIYDNDTKFCIQNCTKYQQFDDNNYISCQQQCNEGYIIYNNVCVEQCPEVSINGLKLIKNQGICEEQQLFDEQQQQCLPYQNLEDQQCNDKCQYNQMYNIQSTTCENIIMIQTQQLTYQIRYQGIPIEQCNQYQYNDSNECIQSCILQQQIENQTCISGCQGGYFNWYESVCQSSCPQYFFNTSTQCVQKCDSSQNFKIQNYCLIKTLDQKCSYYVDQYGNCLDNCAQIIGENNLCSRSCSNYVYESKCVDSCPEEYKYYYQVSGVKYCSTDQEDDCKYFSIIQNDDGMTQCYDQCNYYQYLNNTCTAASVCNYLYSDTLSVCNEYCGAQYVSQNRYCQQQCRSQYINNYGICIQEDVCMFISASGDFCYNSNNDCEVVQDRQCRSRCDYFDESMQCLDNCTSSQYQLELISGTMCLGNCYTYSQEQLTYNLYNMPDQTCVSVCPLGYYQLKDSCTLTEQYNRKCPLFQSLTSDFECIQDYDVQNINNYTLYPKGTDKVITDCAVAYKQQCVYRECQDYQVWILDGCYQEDLCYGKIEYRIENDYTARVCVYDEDKEYTYEYV